MCLIAKTLPPQSELRRLFHHEQDYHKGAFIRLARTSSRALVGDIAGSLSGDGYIHINLNAERYKLHRLVWKWHGRELIKGMVIDHINDNKVDNRIDNLQQITHSENLQKAAFKNKTSRSSSKFRGVSWFKRDSCWRARAHFNGKYIYIGYFKCEIEAAKAYDAKVKELGGLHPLNFPDF